MADALFDDAQLRGMPAGTWTVGELSTQVARVLAGAFPDDVWVAGQIRNLNRSSAGHVYFDLAEPTAGGDTPKAQLSVTLLAPERHVVNEQLKRAGGAVRMDDGIEVRLVGRVRWYGPRGTVQLRMHGIDPAFTLGRLEADRDRILAALAADGLLDRNGRLAMPAVPLRVGLVTSVGSAAHADVLATLEASGIGFVVRQVHARTQGPDCGPQVAAALARVAAAGVDVVLLVRGGGARTDLAAFDTDRIARAIATLDVPVLTGIGHEIDRTIADEVAHAAHKTPTAAAAAVVARVQGFQAAVDDRAARLGRAVHRTLEVAGGRLDERRRRTARLAELAIGRHQGRIEATAQRVPAVAVAALDRTATALDEATAVVAARAPRAVGRAERRLAGLEPRVAAVDPARALARGWSITTTADGRLVRSVADAPPGATLVTRVADGTVTSTATETDDSPPTRDPGSQEPAP